MRIVTQEEARPLGGIPEVERLVSELRAALAAHAGTEGVPPPTADPLIEALARLPADAITWDVGEGSSWCRKLLIVERLEARGKGDAAEAVLAANGPLRRAWAACTMVRRRPMDPRAVAFVTALEEDPAEILAHDPDPASA